MPRIAHPYLRGSDPDAALLRALREGEAESYRYDPTKETKDAYLLRLGSDVTQGLITKAQADTYIWNAFGNPNAKIFTSTPSGGVIGIKPADVPDQTQKSQTQKFLDWWRCDNKTAPWGIPDEFARIACYVRNGFLVLGGAAALSAFMYIVTRGGKD